MKKYEKIPVERLRFFFYLKRSKSLRKTLFDLQTSSKYPVIFGKSSFQLPNIQSVFISLDTITFVLALIPIYFELNTL